MVVEVDCFCVEGVGGVYVGDVEGEGIDCGVYVYDVMSVGILCVF